MKSTGCCGRLGKLLILLLPFLVATGSALGSNGSERVLEEVLVTARKRAEPLLKTPISITAFTRAELEERQLSDISEIGDYTPNLEFDFTTPLSGSSNSASVFIRGVGQTDYVPNKDPGVGIYVDGVYLARSIGSVLNLLDVERVEVLRGPQGTLFGKNTVGGAIDVTLAKPARDFAGEAELTIGSFDRRDFRGYFNTPLTDSIFLRGSAGIFRRDGYVERLLAGDRLGSDREEVGRLAVRWLPDDGFMADLSLDYSHANEQSTASRLLSTDSGTANTPFPIGDPRTAFAGQGYNVLIGGQGPCFTGGLCQALPPLPPDTTPYDRRWLTDSTFTTYATGPNYSRYRTLGANLTLNWKFKDLELKSISGYRITDSNFARDPDGSPLVITHTEVWSDHKQFSQELQVNGQALDDRLDFVAGAFYLDEKGKQRDLVPFIDETFRIYQTMGLPIPNFLHANGPDSVNRIKSLALYGEGSIHFGGGIEFTAGLRWTGEERETVANTTQGGQPAVINPRGSLDFSEITGRAILAYDISESLMAYASYSEGFKSGGFNHRFPIPPPGTPQLEKPTQFAPESVDTFELGFKARLWDGRGQLSAAAFHSRYRDIQVLVVEVGAPRTVNAAAAEINGFEFEMQLAATEHWQWNLAYGYLDAHYTKLDDEIPGAFDNIIPRVQFTLESEFVNSPRNSLAIGASGEYNLENGSLLRLRADARYRSEVANDSANVPELIQDELWLFSASLAWTPPGCPCEISLFGQNLTDETYFVSGIAGSGTVGTAEIILARPREWGLRARWRFD